ncbi:MAG: helix-turn-helix transcriptional regulator [Pseudomonadota bacterium]
MADGRLDTRSAAQLSNRLAELRQAKGLSQLELADAAGVSRKTINTVERGVFVPSTILALRLAEVLEVQVEDIFSLASVDNHNI